MLDLALNTRRDHRGALTYVEHAQEQLPFVVRRIFWLYDVTAPRGGHSHKSTRCALLCVGGQCRVTVKNSDGEFTHDLNRANVLLLLEASDWHLVEDMSEGSTLIVFCSTLFTPHDYVTAPPPVTATEETAVSTPVTSNASTALVRRRVPFFDLTRNLGPMRAEMDAAYARVMDSGSLVLGVEVREFEREFVAALGDTHAHAIGVGSGTAALELALHTVGAVDNEVILTANAGVPTASAVDTIGAWPVFVDVCADTGLLDIALIASALSPRTRAVVGIHLYGCALDIRSLRAELDRLGRPDVAIIEDCAQAFGTEFQGTRVGLDGDIGCFSFYPTKNLGAFGDGGMLVTRSQEHATTLRRMRQYGWDGDRSAVGFGVNSRLDEMQAAMLRVRLRHIDGALAQRRRLAAVYDSLLAQVPGIRIPTSIAGHSYHLYTVLIESTRSTIVALLREFGISCGIHYSTPAHAMPRFLHARTVGANRSATLTHTDECCARTLTLPLFPGLTEEDVTYVAGCLVKACEEQQ